MPGIARKLFAVVENQMDISAASINQFYEKITRGELTLEFDKIGFLNIGYWKGVEDSLEIAQINLIETLAGFFSRRGGTVLDVACGKGASTKYLTKYFDPKKITGINISEAQLQVCRLVAPECNFKLMDATQLDFQESSFDNVLCIEAAQHFVTRDRFLKEAYRVLSPGGRLALHDLVLHDADRPDTPNPEIWPKQNYLPDLDSYRHRLAAIGFRHVRVEDITQFSMNAVMKYLARKLEKQFDMRPDPEALRNTMDALNGKSPWMPDNCTWCMAFAIK